MILKIVFELKVSSHCTSVSFLITLYVHEEKSFFRVQPVDTDSGKLERSRRTRDELKLLIIRKYNPCLIRQMDTTERHAESVQRDMLDLMSIPNYFYTLNKHGLRITIIIIIMIIIIVSDGVRFSALRECHQ